MADGRIATFARRYGFSKSGIWHWVNNGGLPSLRAWLTIALHGGIGLDRLFAGEIEDWTMPNPSAQLLLALPESPRAGIRSRELDWDAIRGSLQVMIAAPEPVALHDACARLGVSRKQLYLRANTEARVIADRYRRHQSSLTQKREERLHAQIGELLDERLAAGYEGMSARELWSLGNTDVQSLPSVFKHIRTVRNSRRD